MSASTENKELAETEAGTEKINLEEDNVNDLMECDGEKLFVILQVEHPNVIFRFGVPSTHNDIPKSEVAFIQVHHRATGETNTTYLDRGEVINYQLGLALIVNEVFRPTSGAEDDEEIEDTSQHQRRASGETEA